MFKACALPALAVLLAAAPVRADEVAPPARMTECTVLPETIDRRVAPPKTIRVSFMITGNVPADLVGFTATAPGGGLVGFAAHGYFSKTIMIAGRELHADSHAPARALAAGVPCALTSIRFVDGTWWLSPPP